MLNPEIVLAVAVPAAGLLAARFHWRWTGCWEAPLARIARHRTAAVFAVSAAPVLLRLALLPWFPAPEPRAHDEFSFLLAADTFAHGRLANAPLPSPVHFASMHILMEPTYASAFPVAPAASLALGMALLGHPWAGVLLSIALMCGALCWMLQGWVPPRWALLGAGLFALRLGVATYWMNSYWGGTVAATGGALVLGSLPRLLRRPNWRCALVMALGLGILGHSRPYEGGVLGSAVTLAMLAQLARSAPARRHMLMRQVIVPLGAALLLVAAATAWYFYRVTGNPLLLPYALYRSTSAVAPHFLWQSPRPEPLYSNNEMRYFFLGIEMHYYNLARHAPFGDLAAKSGTYWRFYFGPLLTIPLLTVPVLWRDRTARRALLAAGAFGLLLAPEVWHNVHYAAPATALAAWIAVLGMRRLRLWRWHDVRTGLQIVRLLPPACAVLLAIQIGAGMPPTGQPSEGWRWPPRYAERARILRQLAAMPGRQLVFVRYGRKHDPGNEWVYNNADIASSKVAWARELDPRTNARLRQLFAGRRVWLVEPDLASPRLEPYDDAPRQPMRFVPLGAPGIEVLQPGERLTRGVLNRAGTPPGAMLSCEAWNAYFTAETGVEAPDPTEGCAPGKNRAAPVTFERWYTWLRRYR